jgi:pyruvate dehydrogenase E1 component alpha subunit
MFETYDPRKGKCISLLKPDGKLSWPAGKSEGLPRLSDEQALKAYKIMVLARQADEWTVNLNRQGRMPTYPPNKGQEANGVGALLALKPDDWLVPAFRELGALLARGIPLSRLLLYWYGNEQGSRLDRESYHTLPMAVPVGSQPLHAVGLAYAEKVRASGRIALTYMGEGATSEGEVHEAFNLAGVWGTGVIFYVQNNQWAISLPTGGQTASMTVAEKAFAYGFEGVRIDGNDLFAVYAAVSMAAEAARKQSRPVLIEGYTYRLGAHTTADDPKRYRDDNEVRKWEGRDPLVRLEKYLLAAGLLSAAEAGTIREEALQQAKEAFREAEAEPDPTLEDTFAYMFAALPEPLKRQLAARRRPG